MSFVFQLLKYLSIALLLMIISGCSYASKNAENKSHFSDYESQNTNHEYMVFIANIEWVKLYPNEMLKDDFFEKNAVINDDGLWEITVSNGCGKAEIEYKTQNGEFINVWMGMGEWCKNPFDNRYNNQLIVVDSNDNRLKEYYPIEETPGGKDVICFLEFYQHETSVFRDLFRTLDEPLYLFPESRANEAWIEGMTEEGLIENIDFEIWALKGVYVSDVIDLYNLKKEGNKKHNNMLH